MLQGNNPTEKDYNMHQGQQEREAETGRAAWKLAQ